jgi:hypothetical protein
VADDVDVLFVRERRRLAGRAAGDEPVRPAGDLLLDQLAEGARVDGAAAERRHERRE